MPKVVRIGTLFAIVAIALTAQGCWDEQPHELTFLGEGGCRTADGGEGELVTVAASSSAACRRVICLLMVRLLSRGRCAGGPVPTAPSCISVGRAE